MKKSAQIKFAKAINSAADQVYVESFLKRAMERGVKITSEQDLDTLFKTAAALRTVAKAIEPAVKEANSAFLSTALDSLLAIEL